MDTFFTFSFFSLNTSEGWEWAKAHKQSKKQDNSKSYLVSLPLLLFYNISSQVHLQHDQGGCFLVVALPVSICSSISASHLE